MFHVEMEWPFGSKTLQIGASFDDRFESPYVDLVAEDDDGVVLLEMAPKKARKLAEILVSAADYAEKENQK